MVKAKTLQVVWHSKEPVYSVDFHPNGQLVTGGADKEVKVWEVERGEDGYATVRHISSLTAHLNTVNCVRFSPTGTQLASSGDSGEVLVWEPVDSTSGGTARRGNLDEGEGEASWRRSAALKGHAAGADVMDVCWAPDGTALASGAINHEVIVFAWGGKRRGEHAARFINHKHFVQGVAWDPAQQYVVSQSADRTCRVFALKPPAGGRKNKVSQHLLPAGETARDLYCAHTLSKRVMAGDTVEGGGKAPSHPLFADERVPSFFRRPTWSPDGSLLVVPAGIYKSTAEGRELNTAYVYARGKWSSPVMHLPGHTKPIVVVRFCPVLFKCDEGQQDGQPQPQEGTQEGDATADSDTAGAAAVHPFHLPYKMVLAVATLDSVVLYDTQSALPLAVLGHLHYDSITDMAWSSDGQYLAVSSRDCYCSIAAFDAGELGTPLAADRLPAHIAKRMAAAQRRAEPVKTAPGAATPAAGQPAAAQQAADAPVAAKLALTPVAQPTQGAVLVAKPAVVTASAAVEKAPGALAAVPAPLAGCKRIQPEPVHAPAAVHGGAEASGTVLAGPASAAAADQPATKKPKRIVPEAVGPAPAVVGDSQQGGAEPSRYFEPPVPVATKAPRHIVPDAVGGGAGANAEDDAAAHRVAAAGVPSKPPRRIVAEAVPVAGTVPSAATMSSLPAESAASGKAGPKRITPTPLRAAEAVSQQFGAAASQHPVLPAPSELSRDGQPASARRITPVLVVIAQALPQGQERTATACAPKGIAALAAAMGAAAAKTRGE